ncbi:MAG: glycosyltransferase family 39 protein [Elusimicrobiota bacterium]|jgi:hypothetical protein
MGAWLGAAVFFALVGGRNAGFFHYWMSASGSADIEAALRHCGAQVLFAAAVLAASWGAGRIILRVFIGEAEDDLMAHLLSFGLGLGAISSCVFWLGLAGLLGKASFLGPAALFSLAAVFELRSSGLPGLRWEVPPMTSFQGLLAGLVAYCAWNGVIRALAPQTAWDVLAYHLALPKLYLRWGGIREIPWLLHSHWPHLMEVLYSVPLAWGLEGAAGLIHLSTCAVLAAATCLLARDAIGHEAALPAAAILVCQPVFYQLAGTAHSDGGFAMFHLLACAALLRWRAQPRAGWLAAAGLLSGFCASSKLFGVALMAALALWLWRSAKRMQPVRVYLSCGLSVCLPWFLKTWVGAGNPVWPFMAGIFGGRWGAEKLGAAFVRSQDWSVASLPGHLFRDGAQFLLVPLLALGVMASPAVLRRRPAAVRFLLFPFLIYLPAVFQSTSIWRYCLPFFPALAILSAWLAAELMRRKGFYKALAGGILAISLLPAATATQNNELFAVLEARSNAVPGEPARRLYLRRSLDCYGLYEAANRLPAGARVLLFREIRGYHLDADYQWGDPLNQAVLDYDSLDSVGALIGRLRGLGITHVIVNDGVGIYRPSDGYYTPRIVGLMERMLAVRGRLVSRDGEVSLYEVFAPIEGSSRGLESGSAGAGDGLGHHGA